ncbi:MAG: hypothetical protein KBS52_02000, partial [Clostridiales bacterium]|nr:hypothetical protein [Candidatus Equinaster intestinalis]
IMICFCSCGPDVKFIGGSAKTSPSAEDIENDEARYVNLDVEITGKVKKISTSKSYDYFSEKKIVWLNLEDGDNTWSVLAPESDSSIENIYVGNKIWAKGKCHGAIKDTDGNIAVQIYAEEITKVN